MSTVRGAVRPSAADTIGALPPEGRYDVYVVVLVSQNNGSAIGISGGSWPIDAI